MKIFRAVTRSYVIPTLVRSCPTAPYLKPKFSFFQRTLFVAPAGLKNSKMSELAARAPSPEAGSTGDHRQKKPKIRNARTPYSPPTNRGMKKLDRSKFTTEVPFAAVYFPNPSCIGQFCKLFKDEVLKLPGINKIISLTSEELSRLTDGRAEASEPNIKAILLKRDISDVQKASEILSTECKTYISENNGSLFNYIQILDYNYWNSDEILASILPEDLLEDIPTGFTVVGHIAHLNLRDSYLPYKYLIGEVILDKNPSVETVVNKLQTINTTYRTFDMEVLAGRNDFLVEQHESGCTFVFDFSKVYWNTRLSTEHGRILKLFKPGDLVVDVMAGVGPFAVPAGKKGCFVIANDLNPHCFSSLKQNIMRNKVGSNVYPFNEDGGKVIRDSTDIVFQLLERNPIVTEKQLIWTDETGAKLKKPRVNLRTLHMPRFPQHYVMNLPDSAIEFLHNFVGIFNKHPDYLKFISEHPNPTKSELESHFQQYMPIVHVHCFQKYSPFEPEPTDREIEDRIGSRIADQLKHEVQRLDDQLNFHFVRSVAPTKPMYCASFRLPVEVAFRPTE